MIPAALLSVVLSAGSDFGAELNRIPTAESLRGSHERLGSEPHIAGTVGDRRVIEYLEAAFSEMGLEVETHRFKPYLAEPLQATVEILSPTRVMLPVVEDALTEDPSSMHPRRTIGFNAYSGTGDVRGEVVYANYATLDDFARLRESGVEVRGRIVLARYGRNYRGFKAKFAEEAGAIGLIIYTDPADSGTGRGAPYPEGGWANDSSIQRGSILTLDYPGDPLTPFEPATDDAKRLDPATLALPKIPVQPVGWRVAEPIIAAMTGPLAPTAWRGGLDVTYRLAGGESLRVRLAVRQRRELRETANVIATLRGATAPDQLLVIGCHHDAWGCGAGDPLAGTMVLLETARSFAALAREGRRPARSIVFAAWGAEEYGIIGSVEYCELERERLLRDGVAYINLDGAAMGTNFNSSSAPSLKRVVIEASKQVAQPPADTPTTIFDAWRGELDEPSLGDLGGGSDHVGFYCHLGIPSCSLGGGGAAGTAYHSNYDTLAWYRKVVGDDYASALMVTHMTNRVAASVADDAILPLDLGRYVPDTLGHLEKLRARAATVGVPFDDGPIRKAISDYRSVTDRVLPRMTQAADDGTIDEDALAEINILLLGAERAWLLRDGLPHRPWYRSLYAATDPTSGYAAWMLPGLRGAIEARRPHEIAAVTMEYVDAIKRLRRIVEQIEAKLPA